MKHLIALVLLALTAPAQTQLTSRTDRVQRIQKAATILTNEKPTLGFTADDTFQPAAAADDSLGRTHVRFRRFYKGVRVYAGDVKASVDRTGASGAVARFDPKPIVLLTVKPQITAEQAKNILLQEVRNAAGLKTELVIYTGPRLAWVVKALTGDLYIIDALTGTVITRQQMFKTAEATVTGTGYTRNSEVPITHLAVDGKYRLIDATRGRLTILDMQQKQPSDSWHGAVYEHGANTWGILGGDWEPGDTTTGAVGQTAAVEAYYAGRVAYDMLWNVFGRKSLDDEDSPMKLRVHARKDTDEPYSDAHWDNEHANFGDGDVDGNSRTDLFTVGHELGHGVFQYAIGEDNSTGEAAGINEGHGDIMGTLTRIYAWMADQQGWKLPTPPSADGYFWDRSIRPWNYYASGQQGLAAYVNGMGDKEEHAQGCAYGRMFAMLMLGAPGTYVDEKSTPLYTAYLPKGMKGIGAHKAAHIWYLATIAKLDSNPTFSEAREAWLEAAADLYGGDSAEYRSVNNAFAGINVGTYIEDTLRPQVNITATVDNGGQYVKVEVTAVDDLGVSMEIRRDGSLIAVVNGSEWSGFADLSGTNTGPKVIEARVCDVIACKDFTKGFTYQGADHLLKNGRFESGSADWENSSVAAFKTDEKRAFLGKRYAEFGYGRWIRQLAQPAKDITKLQLGFRVAVNSTFVPVVPGEQLFVEILDEANVLLQTVRVFDVTAVSEYLGFIHDLPGLAGKKIKVQFRCSSATIAGRFRVDNVYLIYEAPPRADFTVTVDENEASVFFAVKNITGIGLHQVREIEFSSASVPAKLVLVRFDSSNVLIPLQAVSNTFEFITGTPYSVDAKLRTWNNQVHPLGTKPFTVQPILQLIRNPGFEKTSDWEHTANAGYASWNHESQSYPFLGLRFFWLAPAPNSTAQLKQWISLPGTAHAATLTFRLSVITSDPAGDSLLVKVRDKATNAVLGTLASIPNTVLTNIEGSHMGYRKFTYDLLPYKGKVIYISFEALEDATHPTMYWLDNVGVKYTTP